MHCRNYNCVNYFEEYCDLNIKNKALTLNEDGICECFKSGKNSLYDDTKLFNFAKKILTIGGGNEV